MIKLVAIDIDGTLLDSQRQLSQKNIDAIQKADARGVKIVLCTGRPFLGMKDLIPTLGLNHKGNYAIVFNGAQIRTADTGEIIEQNTLNTADLNRWYDETERVQLPLNIIDNEYVYEPPVYPDGPEAFYVSKITTAPSKRVDYSQFAPNHDFLKFVITVEAQYLVEQFAKIDQSLKEGYFITRSHPFQIEVMKQGVHKGQALKNLGQALNIKPEEMMVLGDQANDIGMFHVAGIAVAMGNAIDDVKETADWVTATNDESGVALAIEHFILNENEEE